MTGHGFRHFPAAAPQVTDDIRPHTSCLDTWIIRETSSTMSGFSHLYKPRRRQGFPPLYLFCDPRPLTSPSLHPSTIYPSGYQARWLSSLYSASSATSAS